jgi:endonuclease/exonuclease/phosphatase family metal-dependent hydrolase
MSAKRMRIASFNVENLDDDGSQSVQDLWPKRVEVMQPMLERMNADILLLQEVHSLDALDELRDIEPYKDYYREHTLKKDGSGPYAHRNLVILSRWEIKRRKQYHHDFADAPMWKKITADDQDPVAKDVSWERPILHAEIELEGNRILHALNLHLKSMIPTAISGQNPTWYMWASHSGWAEGFFLSSIKRVGQALETRLVIDDIFQKKGKDSLIVVGGDFNAEIGSVPFKAIVGSSQDTQNADISDLVMVPCEYNVPPEQRYSLLHHGKGNMLDHLIVSKALYPHWERTSIYNEILPDESLRYADDKKFPESDHAPVVAHFNVPDNWIA